MTRGGEGLLPNLNIFQSLTPAQCAISPLNPVFAPFVGFSVRPPIWLNNIDLSETTEEIERRKGMREPALPGKQFLASSR
jgi:hypothetical protein